jgi:hypothetical protein
MEKKALRKNYGEIGAGAAAGTVLPLSPEDELGGIGGPVWEKAGLR